MALKEIEVEWDTFRFKVWCVIGPHRCLAAYVKKRLRRVHKPQRDAGELGGLYFPSVKSVGVLWICEKPKTPKAIGYLVHEMGHAVMDMHSQRGIKLETLNDETFCYAIEHGVRTVLEGCK